MIKKKRLDINYLELTPERVLKFSGDNENIVLLLPKFNNKFLKSLIPSSKPKHISVKLDELGSQVWNTIDGEKKVQKIISELSEKLGDKIHPAEERIIKFLSQLFANKFIQFKELNNK